jgi:hypothetical protein
MQRRCAGAAFHYRRGGARYRAAQRVARTDYANRHSGWRLDSERFRIAPRTCGCFRRILSLH